MTWVTKWTRRVNAFGEEEWRREMGSITAKIKKKSIGIVAVKYTLSILVPDEKNKDKKYIKLGLYSKLKTAKKKLPEKIRTQIDNFPGTKLSSKLREALEKEGLAQ